MQYSQKIDHFIVTTLFLLSAVVLFELLNIQYQYPFVGGERIDVGVIKNTLNNVRKKSIDHASWTDAKNTTRIFNNDKIFTDNNAKATLEFKSGNELVVNEESLLKISFSNNVFNLNVEKGSFLANFNSDDETFLLLLDGKEYKLKSKKGSVRITDKKLSVVSGVATVISGDHEILLNEGQVTDLSQSKLQISKDFPSKLNTNEESNFYILPGDLINLKWEYAQKLDVFLSKDSSFESPMVLNEKLNTASVLLEEGMYYIKFKDMEEMSSVRQFRVVYETKPSVEINKTLYFEGQTLRGEIRHETFGKYDLFLGKTKVLTVDDTFSYSLKEAGNFEISARGNELGRTSALASEPVIVKVIPLPTTGPAFVTPDNGQEFYFYGKNTIQLSLKSLYDVDYGFLINDIEYPSLSSQLDYPVDQNQTIRIKTYYKIDNHQIVSDQREVYVFIDDSNEASEMGKKFVLKKPGQEVSFNWEKSNSETYLLEISRTSTFSKMIKSVKTTSSSANIEFQDVGDLYWRVKKILPDGGVEFSKPEKLILLKPAPPAAPNIKKVIYKRVSNSNIFLKIIDLFISSAHAADEEISDRLEWEKLEGVQKYQIEIIDPKTKRVIVDKVIEETSFSLDSLKPGNYKYRVASIDFWGQRGEFSEYSELEIKKVSLEIKLIYPQHAKAIEAKKQLFEWRLDAQSSKKKQSFQVEISHDLNFSSSANFLVKGEKIEIDLTAFEGNKIYWRVVDTNDRAIISKRRSLNVKNKKEEVKFVQKIEVEKEKNDTYKFSYMPSMYKSEVDEISIDGNNFISFGVDFRKSLNTTFSFYKISGKVFEDLDLSSNEFVATHLLKLNQFLYGGGISLKYATGYKISDNEVEVSRTLITSAFLEIGYKLNSINLSGRLFFGNESGFGVRIIKEVKSIKYLSEVGIQFQSLKSDELGEVTLFGPIFTY